MAAEGWESGPPRDPRAAALRVGVALAVVILVAVLVRPGSEEPPEVGVLPTPQETTPPIDEAEVEPAPEPTGAPDVDQATEVVRSFDPSRHWRPMAGPPFDGGLRGPAAWDGAHLLAWPGRASGGAYDPERDVWSTMPAAPIERMQGWSATWTGTEMIVWGGEADDDMPQDGAAFDPRSFRWRRIADAPIAGRTGHVAVWAGGGLLIWGGTDANGDLLADGALYRPQADEWEVLPQGPLSPRTGAHGVWLGNRGNVLIWGGLDGREEQRDGASLVDGAEYRPTQGWRSITSAPVPLRGGASVVYTGASRCPAPDACGTLLVWGRAAAGLHERDGYAYDLHTDTWSELPNLLNQTRYDATALWTGSRAVVWGGIEWRGRERRQDGYVYDPVTHGWVQIPARPGNPGADPSVIWTGEDLIVFSGADDGWRYPLADPLGED